MNIIATVASIVVAEVGVEFSIERSSWSVSCVLVTVSSHVDIVFFVVALVVSLVFVDFVGVFTKKTGRNTAPYAEWDWFFCCS